MAAVFRVHGHAQLQTAATARSSRSRDRGRAAAAVVAFLDFAQELGVTRLVSHTWFDHSPTTREERPGVGARHAAFWQKVLAGRGIEVYLENSSGHTPEVLAAEVDTIGLPQVGACLDVGHAHYQGSSPLHRWVEVLGPRLRHLHLHDNDGNSDQHLAMGAGTMDWPPLFAALRWQGLRPTATLEVETVPDIAASRAPVEAVTTGTGAPSARCVCIHWVRPAAEARRRSTQEHGDSRRYRRDGVGGAPRTPRRRPGRLREFSASSASLR